MLEKPVFVVTGPSGAGKGTLIDRLIERVGGLDVAISATTRPRRTGERDGEDYWFLTEEDFSRRVEDGEFLEHVVYVSGRQYGTLRSEIARARRRGNACVLELETEGALTVKHEVPGALTIFITAPLPELERRLRLRASESDGEIGQRLELAGRQLEQAGQFDRVVVNDDVDRATNELAEIVTSELDAGAGTMVP